MGGYGSGRWRERRQVVENCYYIAVEDLPYLYEPVQQVTLPLKQHGGEQVVKLICHFLQTNIESSGFGIKKQIDLENYHQVIPFDSTPTGTCGERTCFVCPLGVGQAPCMKLVRRLYLPPGEDYFGCRSCHKLSYTSSQRREERRKERMQRMDLEVDKVFQEHSLVFADIDNKKPDFETLLRLMKRTSCAISDIIESLRGD